jgi:hypothetical protein
MHRTDVARQFHGVAFSLFSCAPTARGHFMQEAQGGNKTSHNGMLKFPIPLAQSLTLFTRQPSSAWVSS